MKLFTIKKDRIVPFNFEEEERIGELLYSYDDSFRVIKIEEKYRKKINDYLMRHKRGLDLDFDEIMKFIDLLSTKTTPEFAVCSAFNDFIPFDMNYSYEEIIRSELNIFIRPNDDFLQSDKERFIDDIIQTINKEGFIKLWVQRRYPKHQVEILPDELNNSFWVYVPAVN